jgi:6-phosphofructokinase
MSAIHRIGVLTGGGDAPGSTRSSAPSSNRRQQRHRTVGIEDSFDGCSRRIARAC